MSRRWTFVRRGLILALVTANAFLLIRPRSGAEEDPPAVSERNVRRAAPSGADTPRVKAAAPPASAPATGGGERIISVPVSLFRQLSVVPSSRIFDEETATLSASAAAILGVSATTQAVVSTALQNAARRHAAIQRSYAGVNRRSATEWTIVVPARANAAKTALLKQLESDLLKLLPAEKAAYVSLLAGHALLMGVPKDGQTFEIKWSAGWVEVSIRSSSYISNGGMAAPMFRKNMKLSWIDNMLPRDGGREER